MMTFLALIFFAVCFGCLAWVLGLMSGIERGKKLERTKDQFDCWKECKRCGIRGSNPEGYCSMCSQELER